MRKKVVFLMFLLGFLTLSTTILAQSALVIWANNGQDKVTRDELRAHASATAVYNSVWNGTRISVFGAKNEVIAFNLILESPTTATNNVRVTVSALSGPGGFTISGRTLGQGQLADGLFNYVGRNIELFYVRYLQIRGISRMAYNSSYYDERHAPIRLQRPMNSYHVGVGTWNDRPDHDKYYPDIAVPLELHTPFSIPANSNQSIWVDVFIPKNAPTGVYNGTVTVQVGTDTTQIPVILRVRDFTLPDIPSAKTMLVGGDMEDDTNLRYTGVAYPNAGTPEYNRMIQVSIRHNQMAHRHKISSLRGGWAALPGNLKQEDIDQLTGVLFTPARGYDGPGIGTGSNVLSVGTYGAWRTTWGFTAAANDNERRQIMWNYSNQWVDWFNAQNFQTPTEFFLYLIDESTDYAQTERWAGWLENNPGSGSALMSFATINVPHAAAETPSLDVACFAGTYNIIPNTWENATAYFLNNPDKRLHMYNGHRRERGSFCTEDEGISLRVGAWAQFKKKIDRWFFWQSTYYNDNQSGMGQTNVFQSARTFGGDTTFQLNSPARGRTGWNYSNGDGVLFYPGTELHFPTENYGINGPIASLRLKLWRRGIQDVDYLTLASNIDPAQTNAIVNRIIPQVIWEYGAGEDSSPTDPTWVKHDISWSVDPDVWEEARVELADIIDGGSSGGDTTPPSVPQNLSATAVSSSQINLSWTASTDNVGVTGYRIYRGGTQIATTTGTTYSNTGLTASTTYSYTVSAYDAAGNNSAQSSSASATTQAGADTQAPTVPQNLSATAVSSSQINLSWTASTDNVAVTGYRIYRGGTQIAATAGTTYNDTGLTASTTYSYTVSAYDVAGNESNQSNQASATTRANAGDTTPPTTPTNLSATAVSSSQINLSWTASTDNVAVTGYRIYRGGINIATTVGTTYSNTGLTANTTYTYTVLAYDAVGNNSVQSNQASATTRQGSRGTNRPPVLNRIGDKVTYVGHYLTFKVTATDPDNDTLSFSATNLPAGATFNGSTGMFFWQPNSVGIYRVTFRVSDGTLVARETIMITVKESDENEYGIVINMSGSRETDRSFVDSRDYGKLTFRIAKGHSAISRVVLYRKSSGEVFRSVKEFPYKGEETINVMDIFIESGRVYTYKIMVMDGNGIIIGNSNEVSL